MDTGFLCENVLELDTGNSYLTLWNTKQNELYYSTCSNFMVYQLYQLCHAKYVKY